MQTSHVTDPMRKGAQRPMAGTNLTREEARQRASIISVDRYDVALTLPLEGATFASTTTATFSCSEPGASTFIDLIAPTVESVELNGKALDVSAVVSEGRIALEGLAAENTVTVVAQCAYMNSGEGLHRFVDPSDNHTFLYSQFEEADARRVFTCFDQPDLKSVYKFTVTAPASWTVISNSPTPEPTPAGDDTATWAFDDTKRMSTYIAAIIAGPYERFPDTYTTSDGRTIPASVLCRPSLAKHMDADEVHRITKIGFEYYEKAYDQPYPFDKYDQIFVPEFNAGAMENAGAVTYRDSYVFRSKTSEAAYERRALTILHELAHMWFGNLVTMRWWDDLWLNESFAEWASTTCMAEATQWRSAWTTFAIQEKNWAYRQDQMPSTHPIIADMVDLDAVGANFDGITYAKGASTLKQLVHFVGREAFDKAIVQYFADHKWGNTEFPDLVGALTKASGTDLTAWTQSWLHNSGVNTLQAEVDASDDGTITSFVVHQSAVEEYPMLRPHRLKIGFFNLVDDALVCTEEVEVTVDGATTSIDELVGKQRPALVLLNHDDQTYTKIRLDERSLACAIENLGRTTDSLARVLIWTATWDMARDAEVPTRDLLELVAKNIGAETDSSTRATVLMHAATLGEAYVERSARPSAMKGLAEGLWEAGSNAEAGSDAQLQISRSFVACARAEEHADIVEKLYAGDTTLPGLTIDIDYKWHLVKHLAALGKLDADGIDALLATDDTATGRLHALTAKAAIPTAEAKAEAWNTIVTDNTLANDTQLAVISGFMMSRDDSLLAPYVEPYFDVLESIWEQRTEEMASQVTRWCYPMQHASDELITTTHTYLEARPHLRNAHRRIMIEQCDQAERALRCQARDAKRS